MKKLLLFMFAIVAFAACEQAPIEEQSAVRQDAPETITVGFEGDDTRIQLNEAQKTVWTKGDLVSVFYRSNANQQWKYDGETGARTAELKRVDAGTATRDMDRVVVVYPYNEDYYINPETYNVQASLPAVQNYLKDSYGTNGNIMISSSEYNQFSLKSVCGWLKLQLTGDGETIKSIKFRGNDGEQVAGELYINSADATAALASDMGDADDNNAGGSLVFDDTILTEVTLDCGEGVTLGAEATAFYIALPPQTFEKGFKVVIKDTEGYVMEQSTDKTLIIERNHIQPMAEFEYKTIPNNQIWYTSSDGNVVTPYNTDAFGAKIISNKYNNGMGVITFDGDVTKIGDSAFFNCTSLTSVNIPDSVTKIGNYAFYYCTSLTSANIPYSVFTIGEGAFLGCDSLTSVYCKATTPPALGDTYVFDDNGSGRKIYVPAGSVNAYKSAEYWNEYASAIVGYDFGDSGLVTPEIDDSWKIHYTATSKVTPYDTSAFNVEILSNKWDSTTGKGVITFNGVVETIDSYAFYMCSNLTSVRIPEHVTSIKAGAFRECIKLNDVYLNSKIESIGSGAFTACFDIYNSTYGSINIHLNSIEDWCEISMPVSLVSSQETIYLKINGSTTTDITIPTTIKAIKPYAFRRCAVRSVTLHEEVASIGDKAFYDSWLNNLYCKPTTPPTGGSEMFDETSNLTIYTHRESVDAYKITDGWSEYAYAIVGYDFENGVVVE